MSQVLIISLCQFLLINKEDLNYNGFPSPRELLSFSTRMNRIDP